MGNDMQRPLGRNEATLVTSGFLRLQVFTERERSRALRCTAFERADSSPLVMLGILRATSMRRMAAFIENLSHLHEQTSVMDILLFKRRLPSAPNYFYRPPFISELTNIFTCQRFPLCESHLRPLAFEISDVVSAF